jgi:hypothetical protein
MFSCSLPPNVRLFASYQVCVQGSMGQGAFAGIPLQLAGTRKILEVMDWGDYEAKDTFINFGAVGMLSSYCILLLALLTAKIWRGTRR